MKYMIKRLKEPTSWVAITGFISGAGILIAPELQDIIVKLGVGIACLVGFLMPEAPDKK